MKRSRLIFVLVVFGVLVAGYFRHRTTRSRTIARPTFAAVTPPTFDPLELPGGEHAIQGRVVTDAGVPAAGIDVYLYAVDALPDGGAEPQLWSATDTNGRVAFDGLRASRYEAVLYRQGRRPKTVAFDVPMWVSTTREATSGGAASGGSDAGDGAAAKPAGGGSLEIRKPLDDEIVTLIARGVSGVEPGAEFELSIEAEIERGFHIYGLKANNAMGVPVQITVEDPAVFELIEKSH